MVKRSFKMKIWSWHLLDNLSTWKIQVTQRESNPWPLRCRYSALANWATKSHSRLTHLTHRVESTGSNPVESPEFFRFMRQLLKLSSKCEDHIFISKHRTSYNISFIRDLLLSLMCYVLCGAPWVRKCGKLPTPTARPTVRPHHRLTNAKFRVVCGEGFLANGNPRFVKHEQLSSSGKSTQNKKKFIRDFLP